MTDRQAAAKLWAGALSEPTAERIAALEPLLATDVESVSPTGRAAGKEAVLASFGPSRFSGLFASGAWSAPSTAGDEATATCQFPPGAPLSGLTIRLRFDSAGLISQAVGVMIPSPPPAATAIAVTETMRAAVDGALLNGTPVVVAYVDADGGPHISLRGSAQAYGDGLAMWIRNPQGGIVTALATNPRLALFYRDPAARTSYQFYGRGRVDGDPEVRQTVYDRTPEPERNLDPLLDGVAVVVELDRVEGRDASGPILMERGAPA